ncbi:MAG: hypothetical protein MK211_11610 [Flavobacteriales bacterium]|nr:hypothetical protein [Flavobacteriales bacterium]
MAKPSKCISVAQGQALCNNWQTSRAAAINQSRGNQPDCCEFVFSVEELEEYLEYVKELSSDQGVAKPGIRIYFGAYNDDQSNNATVVLVPTNGTSKTSDNNYSIDPFNTVIGGFPPKLY